MKRKQIHLGRAALLVLAGAVTLTLAACGDATPTAQPSPTAAPTNTLPAPTAAPPASTAVPAATDTPPAPPAATDTTAAAPAATDTTATAPPTVAPPTNTAPAPPTSAPPTGTTPPARPTVRPTPRPLPPTARPPTPKPAPKLVNVRVYDFGFDPPILTIVRGTKVVWTNAGPTDHTVADKNVTWTSDILHTGDVYSRVFDTPGTITVICTLHPDIMISTVVVK